MTKVLAPPVPHPIYVKAAGDRYVTLADTAKLVRLAVARAFPGVKFYVRSSSYSMGSSITVYWDGRDRYTNDAPLKAGMPSSADVSDVIDAFAGKNFDGMIDLAYAVSAWLNPDGSVAYGHSDGTTDSHGSHVGYRNARPAPGSVMVRFGVSYVFATDSVPYGLGKAAS